MGDDSYLCSLVNSHWLYHVWNVNSICFVDLNVLIEKTLDYKESDDESDSGSSAETNCDSQGKLITKDKHVQDELVVEKTHKLGPTKDDSVNNNSDQLKKGIMNQTNEFEDDKNKTNNENDEKESAKIENFKRKNRLIMRTWQRFINVKSICIMWYLVYEKEEYNDIILNRLLLLKNIENINIHFAADDNYIRSLSALKTLLFKSHERISSCTIGAYWFQANEIKKMNYYH